MLQNCRTDYSLKTIKPTYNDRKNLDLVEYFHSLYPETLQSTASSIFIIKDRSTYYDGHGECHMRQWKSTSESIGGLHSLNDLIVNLCEYQTNHNRNNSYKSLMCQLPEHYVFTCIVPAR